MVKRGCVYYPIVGKLCVMMDNEQRSSRMFIVKNDKVAITNNPDYRFCRLKGEEMVKTCDECKFQSTCKLEKYIGGKCE